MTVRDIITAASDNTLGTVIPESYVEIERNHFLQSWKASELDAGHFVEAVRRFIELKLFGRYPPIGTALTPLNDVTLKRYENASGEEAFRLHIPRVLFAMYGIRNKRGVGHLSVVKPNRIDASLILHSAKWVLAEIVRISSTSTPVATERLLEDIIERKLEAIWEIDGIPRVLQDGLKLEDKVLVLLLQRSPQHETELQRSTEYQNASRFGAKLQTLHEERFIERAGGKCSLSPKGSAIAERILAKSLAKELQ